MHLPVAGMPRRSKIYCSLKIGLESPDKEEEQ